MSAAISGVAGIGHILLGVSLVLLLLQVRRSVSFSAQSAGTSVSLSTRYTSACAAPNPSAAHSSISSSFRFIRFPFHKGVSPLTLPRDSVGDTLMLCPRVYAGFRSCGRDQRA